MKIIVFRLLSVFLLISCMFTIFRFSSQDATQSSQVSGGVTSQIFSVVYPRFESLTDDEQQTLIEKASFAIRKTAHFSIYFMLGLFSFLSLISYRRIQFYLRPALSWIVCIIYAASDEIHQLFVPGRSGEVRDVLLDSCGALLAIAISTLICRRSSKIFGMIKTIGRGGDRNG